MSYVFEIELIAGKSAYESFAKMIAGAGYSIKEINSTFCSRRYQIDPRIDNALEANARAGEISDKIRTAAKGMDILDLEQRSVPSPEMRAEEQRFLERF